MSAVHLDKLVKWLETWLKELIEKVVVQATIDDQILFVLYGCVSLLILVNYVLLTKYRDRANEMGPLLKFFTKRDRVRLGLGCVFGIYVGAGLWFHFIRGEPRGLWMMFGFSLWNLVYDSLTLKDLSGFSLRSFLGR